MQNNRILRPIYNAILCKITIAPYIEMWYNNFRKIRGEVYHVRGKEKQIYRSTK